MPCRYPRAIALQESARPGSHRPAHRVLLEGIPAAGRQLRPSSVAINHPTHYFSIF